MAKLQISLPEDLARDAQEMGLLEPDAIANILREEVRKLAFEDLLSIADKLAAAGDIPMTQEEVQEEIRAARRDQHAVVSGDKDLLSLKRHQGIYILDSVEALLLLP